MKKTKTERRSGCPISFTLDVAGDKWTLLVIRDIAFLGKRYFQEFLASPEKIATNILAERLERLEAARIISRSVDPQKKSKVLYTLTDKGIALIPVLLEMVLWGAEYDPRTEAPPEFIKRLKKDRASIIREFEGMLNPVRVKLGNRSRK